MCKTLCESTPREKTKEKDKQNKRKKKKKKKRKNMWGAESQDCLSSSFVQ